MVNVIAIAEQYRAIGEHIEVRYMAGYLLWLSVATSLGNQLP